MTNGKQIWFRIRKMIHQSYMLGYEHGLLNTRPLENESRCVAAALQAFMDHHLDPRSDEAENIRDVIEVIEKRS